MKHAPVVALAFLLGLATAPSFAQKPADTPVSASGTATPMLMLNLTKDHQLSSKAYTEYMELGTDANGLPRLGRTYARDFAYYGYFDSARCYSYVTASNRFEPQTNTVSTGGSCAGGPGRWSGNFLNWLTMSRMDVVRKILYGGLRIVDTADTTVLERQYTPPDSHSYAKWLRNSDLSGVTIADVTPFSNTEVTFCIVSKPNMSSASKSHNSEYDPGGSRPPLIRAVAGNYLFWGTGNERQQCLWSGERVLDNGNVSSLTGISAAASNPAQSSGLGTGIGQGEYAIRVLVCSATDSLRGAGESCRQYPNGNWKPAGLLQEYGEGNKMLFGLMTGSFQKKTSGGVLRSNMASFRDEVNHDTNGTFKSTQGIVYNLNRLRLYGYKYAGTDGYVDNDADGCSYLLDSGAMVDGSTRCRSWGNPGGEIFLESLRYLAGQSASGTFTYGGSSADATLGLSAPAWQDPFRQVNAAPVLPGVGYCSRLNVLNFNASVPSFDTTLDNAEMGGITALGAPASAAETWTDDIGSREGINNSIRSFGRKSGSTGRILCEPKMVNALSDIDGVCPEGPAKRGSWLIAGTAWWAHMNRIRQTVPGATVPATDTSALKVTTYGVSLASTLPTLRIPVGSGASRKWVTLQPAYYVENVGSSGTLVDFKVLSLASDWSSGKFYVSWEDSEQGGDYDNDLWGILEFTVTGNTVQVSTTAVTYSSANPQGFGYVISGVGSSDGAYFHSGAAGWNWTSPNTAVAPSCSNCRARSESGSTTATTGTFTAQGNASNELKDPLWYAAKYGGFDTSGGATAPGVNDVPDKYFYANDPAALAASLQQAFAQSAQSVNSVRAATSTSRVQTGTLVYQAGYAADPGGTGLSWRGFVRAYQFNVDGTLSSAVWDTATWMSGAGVGARRNVFTRNGNAGADFTWATVGSTMQAALNRNAAGATDGLGQARLGWLRGDQTDETPSGQKFRARPQTKLGDIVNSGTWYVGAPRAGFRESQNPGYNAFTASKAARASTLYVGANDGMVHAIDASLAGQGQERFAYVPAMLANRLSALTDPAYTHKFFIDGTPMVGDARIGSTPAWRSVLVGNLGGGGQGVFALDVTDPATVTAANLSLWEFKDSDDPDLGYMISQATQQSSSTQPLQMGKFRNGKWGVLLGNGVYSEEGDGNVAGGSGVTAGRAALYILFLDGPAANGTWTAGTHYVKLVAANGPANGLMMPVGVDTNGDGMIDTAYAGDLKGNLWKFDLSSTNVAGWQVSPTGNPLFRARDAGGNVQPITTQPVVWPTTAASTNGTLAWLVSFGTGKLYEITDRGTTGTQTIYGVLDAGAAVAGRSSLQVQTVTSSSVAGTDTAANKLFRTLSANPVCWLGTEQSCVNGNTQKGYYLDLPDTGERVISNPSVDGSGGLIYASYVPPVDACQNNGYSYIMRFDALTGGRLNGGQVNWDTNGDGIVGGNPPSGRQADKQTDGIKLDGLVPGAQFVTTGATPTVAASGGGGGGGAPARPICWIQTNPTAYLTACDVRRVGRVAWRELNR